MQQGFAYLALIGTRWVTKWTLQKVEILGGQNIKIQPLDFLLKQAAGSLLLLKMLNIIYLFLIIKTILYRNKIFLQEYCNM